MAVDPHEAHTLESRKKVMFATASGKGTSLLGVTRSSTIVARAPVFPGGSHRQLGTPARSAVGGHYSINTFLLYFRRSDLHKVESANPGAKQQPTTATLG